MEIVKTFNENNLHTEIVIKGTSENPMNKIILSKNFHANTIVFVN